MFRYDTFVLCNAEKWANLANNYEQTFIEYGSYKVMFFRRILNGYK